jgi:ABC-type Zn uptake system ZnuABC Zn-binding protein ZnuA
MLSKFFKFISILIVGLFSVNANSQIKVITTTTNAAALMKEVGGEHVDVTSLTTGTQDPHFVEAKPSFMIKVSRADLLVSIGLELELGWLPAILNGARNPNIMPGAKGSLVLGDKIKPLEIVSGTISREHGDVHPDGNPHFMLDPIRVANLALVVADKLSELDTKNSEYFQLRGKKYSDKLQKSTKVWQDQILRSGRKNIFTYHKTLTYFLARMSISSIGYIEPKPGVPPTPSHVLGLIKLAKKQNIDLIIVENYFEQSAAKRIAKDVKNAQVRSVPVAVGGATSVNSLDSLYEILISSLVANQKAK